MACKCEHKHTGYNFPIFAPAPNGPADRWPDYFVPSIEALGYGYYYCPCCRDGLEQARETAGYEKQPEPQVPWWKRVIQLFRTFYAEEQEKNSSAIHSR